MPCMTRYWPSALPEGKDPCCKEGRARALPSFCLGYGAIDRIIYCGYIKGMKIDFDPVKRDKTMAERGLDFARAKEVFAGPVLSRDDGGLITVKNVLSPSAI